MKITKHKPNMTDSKFKEFLRNIATITETDCWVTNYYKTINSKGQARLYYKNTMIFLYQLSHLLFNNNNNNVSNLIYTFHTCNNLICFNPTHLTDDLKDKQFKLEMSSSELLEGYPKKIILIDYGNWLSKELGRPLIYDDFLVVGRISYATIARYFDGSMANYFNSCEFPSVRRKENMADSEMKKFLKDKAEVTENSCWITDYWKTSHPEGRILIKYKGKQQFLYRVSYILFKGCIPNGLVATHSCDNPRCYNPDHLFAKTQKRNMEEASEKGNLGSFGKKRKHHKITDPYDCKSLLKFIKQHIKITEKDEWIFPTAPSQIYPRITINNKIYQLHRLLLANKLGKKYEEINTTCHILPDGSRPNKRDVNPDHLFEGTRRENSLQTAKYSKAFKLNIDEVNQIKEAAIKFDFSEKGSKTSFDKEWAAKLGVTKDCITDIRSGKTWNQISSQALQ